MKYTEVSGYSVAVGKNAATARVMDSRIGYMDVFKGIGIILMIMGHIGFGGHCSF